VSSKNAGREERAVTNAPMISIRNVSKRFPGVVALDGVSIDIQRGELHSICGENGAGKSTLMKILSGVITEYDGELVIRGEAVHFEGTIDAEHAGVSIIHQELNLVEQLSVAANIFLGRELKTRFGFLDDRRMEDLARRLLEELECDVSPREKVGLLRVGDQQLVEIAKALSLESEILIMDEPTSALTSSEVERLYRVIERLRARGVTILYISHKMEEVFRLSDSISVLRDGRHVATVDRASTSPREITHLMVGREIETTKFDAPRVPGAVVLSIQSLSLPWPGHARKWRLENVSLELRAGEILGIAGLMGAGRTELLECIFGCSTDRPRGEIRLEGELVEFRHPREARAAGIALVTEDRKRLGLFAQMNVRENVSICALERATSSGLLRRRREEALAQESIEGLQIKTAGSSAMITSLSGGNQQKAIIGRWLHTRPKVLLLDDPTRGVDVGAKAELYRLMDRLCREGLGIILTSSELPELITVCDRIVVLAEGRLTAEISGSEATEQKIMEAATLSSASRA
jgi:ribose transport system ATP-binding protein